MGVDFAHVRIERAHAVAVVDNYGVAETAAIIGVLNAAVGGGEDEAAFGIGEIESVVRTPALE